MKELLDFNIKIPAVARVYMASETGFKNYCETCGELLLVQEAEGELKRVFCGAEHCSKT